MPLRRRRLPVLPATDDALQEWHSDAIKGDAIAMEKLFLWVYCEASLYYSRKSIELARLTAEDAEDLATQFVLEFESVWRDVRSVARYTRAVLKRNLNRHLAALSERPKTLPLEVLEARNHSVSQTHAPWMTLSDATLEVYNALCQEYFKLPAARRLLIDARLRHPPTPYSAVCRALGWDEGRARVYTNRFLKKVRSRCKQ